MEEKEYYTPKEIAELLGVKPRTIRDWIKQGKIEAVKIGTWRISASELKKVLKSGTSK